MVPLIYGNVSDGNVRKRSNEGRSVNKVLKFSVNTRNHLPARTLPELFSVDMTEPFSVNPADYKRKSSLSYRPTRVSINAPTSLRFAFIMQALIVTFGKHQNSFKVTVHAYIYTHVL